MVAKYQRIKKQSRSSLFFSILLGTVIFVVVGFLVVANWRINQNRAEFNSQIESLQKEIQILEEKRQALQAQISQTSEQEYLEKEARETFNLKKPGEEVVAILPAEEEETPAEKERVWWNPFTW
jgi:cell division protein FtsB